MMALPETGWLTPNLWQWVFWAGLGLTSVSALGLVWLGLASVGWSPAKPVDNSNQPIHTPLAPDWPLHSAFEYVKDESAWGHGRETLEVLDQIRQAASDGRITIWGRRLIGLFDVLGLERTTSLPVPREYWEDHDFENTTAVILPEQIDAGFGARTRDLIPNRPQEIFYDLRVVEEEIRRAWPAVNSG